MLTFSHRTPPPRLPLAHPSPPPAPDPVRFARETLGFHPDPTQEALLQSTARQGILNCCRQWGKSTVAAIKAVHRAHFHPKSLVVVASPTERQSAEFLLKARTLVEKLGIPVRGDGHNRASLRLPNGSRIVGLPGKEGNIRGFSAVNLLIIDEAARVPGELYKALRPMLTVANGDLWLLSTPKGKLGFFHENWEHGGTAWTRFRVPATECPRISPERLEIERGQMDDAWFRQEYMCEFIESDRQIFGEDIVRQAVDDGEAWDLRAGAPTAALSPAHWFSAQPAFIGLDLGQKRDHSAIAVVERLDPRPSSLPVQKPEFRIRYLERIPLGTPYTNVAERVLQLVKHPILSGRSRLAADATGVGAPGIDLLRASRLECPLTAVTITSGGQAHSRAGQSHVPKHELFTGLLVLLESGRLKISRHVAGAASLLRELHEVQTGEHPGDLLVALALACWRATRGEITYGAHGLV